MLCHLCCATCVVPLVLCHLCSISDVRQMLTYRVELLISGPRADECIVIIRHSYIVTNDLK